MPDDVPDDHRDPHPGQRDHVEPVAAHPGPRRREIARGGFEGGGARQGAREQAALQREGGVAFAGEPAGVVDTDGGPGRHLLREQHVVVGERVGPPVPGQHGDPEGRAACRDRYGHRGVDAELLDPIEAGLVPGQPLFEVAGGQGGRDGAAGEEGVGLGREDGVLVQLPGLGHGLGAAREDRTVGRPAQADGRRQFGRAVVAAVLRGVQQVHADEIGERRYTDVRELLRRTGDVEGGADAYARLVDQLETLPREVLLGEVVGRETHAPNLPLGVPERRQPGQPGVRVVLAAGAQIGLHVLGPAAGQHVEHVLLQLRGAFPAADLGDPEPPDALQRQPDDIGHGVVHAVQPQPVVVDGRRTGRLGQGGQREGVLRGPRGALQGRDDEPVAPAAVHGRPVVGEEPYGHRPAVAVTQRERAVPGVPRRSAGPARAVDDQQGDGGSAQHLGRRPAKEPASALVPAGHCAPVVDEGPRRGGIVERVHRAHRRHSIVNTHSEQGSHWCSTLVRPAPRRSGTPLSPGRDSGRCDR